jgi:integrase/recombinase XerD
VQFLTQPEADALVAAPDRSTWPGRRDYAFILLALQTGLRLSEMTGLKREDLCLDRGAHVRVMGKGRKERCTPLAKPTAAVMSAWVKEANHGHDGFVFPSARGARMSPDGVRYLLAKHVAVARKKCASLREKRVTPHVLRHTAAMDLLQGGVDRAVIALWLGHERVETTQIYFHANIALKEAAMAKMNPAKAKVKRFRPDDQLLAFLKAL